MKSTQGQKPQILVGTSGFSYTEWRGSFYPEDLPAKNYLTFYAGHFKTTEINNTFYRLPTAKLTMGWNMAVPPEFVFTLKLSQKITHIKRLKGVDEEMRLFLDAAATLEAKLGPILVQLPPNYRKNTDVLGDFLTKYAPGRKLAFEFRHDSWFADDVYQLLSDNQAVLGIVESEKEDAPEAPRIVTGPFIYMRLRKGEYSESELTGWANWMRDQKVDVYCYMKHDLKAPVLASQMIKSLESEEEGVE